MRNNRVIRWNEPSKYHNEMTEVDGIVFDSQKEANRYRELKLLEKAGEITDLRRQVKYELIPAQYENGECVERALNYIADFVYTENGETIVEDVKGMKTDVYRIKRVMKDDGTLWLNIGDSYWGSGSRGFDFTGKFKPEVTKCQGTDKKYNLTNVPRLKGNVGVYKNKDLIGIPWMLAFALRADGWYLRQDIIWHKPNPMPESVTDRCTKSHEYIFLREREVRIGGLQPAGQNEYLLLHAARAVEMGRWSADEKQAGRVVGHNEAVQRSSFCNVS